MRKLILRWLFGEEIGLYLDVLHCWKESIDTSRETLKVCSDMSDTCEKLKAAYESYINLLNDKIKILEDFINGQS